MPNEMVSGLWQLNSSSLMNSNSENSYIRAPGSCRTGAYTFALENPTSRTPLSIVELSRTFTYLYKYTYIYTYVCIYIYMCLSSFSRSIYIYTYICLFLAGYAYLYTIYKTIFPASQS